VTGVWWRQDPHGSDPLFRATPPADARWQRGSVVGGAYFGDHEDTAWAEWYRALAEFAIPPERQLPRDLWRWEITLERVANLSDQTRLARAGLALPRPHTSEWPAFQTVGEELWESGFEGVLAPSAARPSQRVLCIFRPTDEIPGAQPRRPPSPHRHVPPPPTGLTT